MKKFTWLFIVGLFLLIPFTRVYSAETAPEAVIKDRVDRVLQILDNEEIVRSDTRLRKEVTKTLEPLFDFNEMTLRALGAHGRKLNQQQISRLTTAFKNLLENIYVARFTPHFSGDGNSIELKEINIFPGERRGPYARVLSDVILTRGGETQIINLNFRMVNRGNGWHIYDLEIEGVSLISNYRSQFANILTNHSFDYLLETIQNMTKNASEGDEAVIPDLPGE